MLNRLFRPLVYCLLIISYLAAPFQALGVDTPSEMLSDPIQEKRAETIGAQLRCLVCQNESIEDSSADLAKDLRYVVREHVRKGESDQQIIAWMVNRYGNFIRLAPPFSLSTLILWGMPGLALLIAFLFCFFAWRKQNAPLPALNYEEKQRLKTLLNQNEEKP